MLRLVNGNKRKDRFDAPVSVAEKLKSRVLSLEEELNNTAVYIGYLSMVNYEGKLPCSIVSRAAKLNLNMHLPEIYNEIGKYYVSDSEKYEKEEFIPVNYAISIFINEFLTENAVYKDDDIFLENISTGLKDLYPDPNLFVLDYRSFRAMQGVEGTKSVAGLWFATIANYGNLYSFKKKLEETIEFRELCIKENDVALLFSIDKEIKSELGYW